MNGEPNLVPILTLSNQELVTLLRYQIILYRVDAGTAVNNISNDTDPYFCSVVRSILSSYDKTDHNGNLHRCVSVACHAPTKGHIKGLRLLLTPVQLLTDTKRILKSILCALQKYIRVYGRWFQNPSTGLRD